MTIGEVKNYLENYTEKKAIADYKKRQGQTDARIVKCIQGIESCMESLPDGIGSMLKKLYIEKKSARKISIELYYSRTTLARRRDQAIEIIAECLSDL